jgi:hypothetical protein
MAQISCQIAFAFVTVCVSRLRVDNITAIKISSDQIALSRCRKAAGWEGLALISQTRFEEMLVDS